MKAAIVICAMILGGTATGVAVERAGFFSPIDDSAVVAGPIRVPFYLCPGEDAAGAFRGGDRVYATGRSADEAMLEVRAPFDAETRVWVEARRVIPDSDVSALPEAECRDDIVTTADETTTPSSTGTGTTSPPPSTISTTTHPVPTPATGELPPSTATTEPAPTTATTELPPSTATTEPPPPADTSGPFITVFQADHDELWEDGGPCAEQPRTMQVGGYVEDPSGVQSVWISWDVGSQRGTRMATEPNPVDFPGFYFAEVGPFPDDTLVPDGTAESRRAPIWLEIKAYDDAPEQNVTAQSSTSFTVLLDCTLQ